MLKLKAIIFDYNGVLVDDLIFHRDSFLKVAKDLGIAITEQAIWDLISDTPDAKRVLFGDISDEKWKEIRAAKDIHYFDMIRSDNVILPKVAEVLPNLSCKFTLGLVSNTARSYYERIFPSELAACFKTTLFAGEVDSPKPSPEPLFKTMEVLAVHPDECCYIGDAVSDVQMTRSAGVKMFGITTGHHTGLQLKDAGADWIIDHLGALIDKIEPVSDQADNQTN